MPKQFGKDISSQFSLKRNFLGCLIPMNMFFRSEWLTLVPQSVYHHYTKTTLILTILQTKQNVFETNNNGGAKKSF
jgi:hypothetical protein